MEATRLTDSRGSRPIVQVNSNHATSTDTKMEIPRKIQSNTENSGIPSHLSTASIGVVWPRALRARVTRITKNIHSMARRSDNLVRTKPGESTGCSHHISVNAARRCDIQLRPAQAAVVRPMTPTDARARIAEFTKSNS